MFFSPSGYEKRKMDAKLRGMAYEVNQAFSDPTTLDALAEEARRACLSGDPAPADLFILKVFKAVEQAKIKRKGRELQGLPVGDEKLRIWEELDWETLSALKYRIKEYTRTQLGDKKLIRKKK